LKVLLHLIKILAIVLYISETIFAKGQSCRNLFSTTQGDIVNLKGKFQGYSLAYFGILNKNSDKISVKKGSVKKEAMEEHKASMEAALKEVI